MRFIGLLLSFCLLISASTALAGDVTVIDEDEGVAVTQDDDGNTVVLDDEGNAVMQDKHGNTHVEDADGNTVSMDKHGNVTSADITDDDGQRVIVDE